MLVWSNSSRSASSEVLSPSWHQQPCDIWDLPPLLCILLVCSKHISVPKFYRTPDLTFKNSNITKLTTCFKTTNFDILLQMRRVHQVLPWGSYHHSVACALVEYTYQTNFQKVSLRLSWSLESCCRGHVASFARLIILPYMGLPTAHILIKSKQQVRAEHL